MTDRTWVGGSNNKASNPSDWSPTGAPQPGDALTMPDGTTMNVRGNALAGDTLVTLGNADINTSAGAALDLTTRNNGVMISTVNVHVDGTVNLTDFVEHAKNLTISGGTIHFINDADFNGPGFDGSKTILDGRLTGTATLAITGGNHNGSAVEVNGSVSHGLNFLFAGTLPDISLTIDNPSKFHGLITTHFIPNDLDPQFGFVDFVGIHASSANIHDDILQMFDGKRLVDSVRIDIGDGKGIQLQQNSQGVVLSGASPADIPGGPGTLIPLHVS
jgi:hypothetical protein